MNIYEKALKKVNADHAKSCANRHSKVAVNGITYLLTYDIQQAHWSCLQPDGERVAFNTRSLTTAKKWVREYYTN